MATGARADETQWRDMESRIQYGYYTEDSRALQNLQAGLAADESHDQLRGYYAALVAWRLAQLAVQHPAPQAASPGQLAQRCVSALDGVLEAQADYAEALALRAACLGLPLAARGLHAPFAGRKPRKDIERALQLAPRDPRVLLLDALGDYELPPALGGNKERALVKLRATVAAFEQERTSTEPLPGGVQPRRTCFSGAVCSSTADAVAGTRCAGACAAARAAVRTGAGADGENHLGLTQNRPPLACNSDIFHRQRPAAAQRPQHERTV